MTKIGIELGIRAPQEAILKAARIVLAKDGSDGLSVLRVARLAGINRGTTYQHFPTREDLVKATVESVSTQLCNAVFGDMIEEGDGPEGSRGSLLGRRPSHFRNGKGI